MFHRSLPHFFHQAHIVTSLQTQDYTRGPVLGEDCSRAVQKPSPVSNCILHVLAPSLTAISHLKETQTWFIGIINSCFSVSENFHDDRSLLRVLYKFYIESVLTVSIYCWFDGLEKKSHVHWLN